MRILTVAAVIICGLGALPAWADGVLVHGTSGSISYEQDGLVEEFGIRSLETVSTWTGSKTVAYRGVALLDILQRHGIDDPIIEVGAENGFVSKIPLELIEKYDPIVAFEADGQALDFTTRGPLSLIWPRSGNPEVLSETMDGMWTWYMNEINGSDK